MPHDGHVHTHMHSHDHHHPHPHDHNQAHGTEHLHSHPHGAPGHTHVSDELQDWIDNFVTGFRAADDKTGFLRLARVPFEIDDVDGGPGLKLIDVSVEDSYQVATASPAFASAPSTTPACVTCQGCGGTPSPASRPPGPASAACSSSRSSCVMTPVSRATPARACLDPCLYRPPS